MAIQRLEIQSNNLSSIEDNTFLNLNKLEALFLLNNNLKTLSSSVFCGLTSLNALHLELNHLSTLPADVFSHLPRPLILGLTFHPNDTLYNLLKCDSQLCWLKQEELQGNITWKTWFVVSKPRCADGTNWDSWTYQDTGGSQNRVSLGLLSVC